MQNVTSLNHILRSCHTAIEDGNIEQCFKLLRARLRPDAEIRKEVSQQSSLFQLASKDKNNATLSREEYRQEYAQISYALLNLLPKIQSADLVEEEGIHERILIFTYEANKPNWEKLFAQREFSHTLIVIYDDKVPEAYANSQVIIFDDSGPKAQPYMEQCFRAMPESHFLYYGPSGQNPFSNGRDRDEIAAKIWERTANANTMFTVYARLRELLEFRKIYGPPK